MADVIKNVYVIDASFLLAFLLDEENIEVNSQFERYASGEIVFIVPTLIKYEVGNSLRTQFLRKKLAKGKAKKLYQAFLEMKIKEEKLDFADVLRVALEKNMSFYDASYHCLAQRLNLPLLTLD